MRFNWRSVVKIEPAVQSRTVKLSYAKNNPASFCSCYLQTGVRTCSPSSIEKGEIYMRVRCRVALLPEKDGKRRPIYKNTKWRIECFISFTKDSSLIAHRDWTIKEMERVRIKEQRNKTKEAKRKTGAKVGRPNIGMSTEQMEFRHKLQRKMAVYKSRAKEALEANKIELFRTRTETAQRIKVMLDAQVPASNRLKQEQSDD